VDPTITAAWISGGVGAVGIVSTAVTAWIGSRGTRKATEQAIAAGAATTRATLLADREQRLWERRAAAYEEFLTELLSRKAERRRELREDLLGETAEDQLATIHDDYDPLGSPEMQGRLTAYASDAVLEAFRFASEAHIQVLVGYQQYRWTAITSRKQAAQTQGMADGFKVVVSARRAVDLPAKEAEAADDSLITIIRDELRSRPDAAIARKSSPPYIVASYVTTESYIDDHYFVVATAPARAQS
jgi:hypothetical protein